MKKQKRNGYRMSYFRYFDDNKYKKFRANKWLFNGKIKINGNSYKNILIYHIGYMIKVVSYTTNNINLL